jgi:hypothetical protein
MKPNLSEPLQASSHKLTSSATWPGVSYEQLGYTLLFRVIINPTLIRKLPAISDSHTGD